MGGDSWVKSHSNVVDLLVARGARLQGVVRQVIDFYRSNGKDLHPGCSTPVLAHLAKSVGRANRKVEFTSVIDIYEFEGILRLSDDVTMQEFRRLGIRAVTFTSLAEDLTERATLCEANGFTRNSQ